MSAPASPPLPAREAYRRWAPSYAGETAVSFLEDCLVQSLGISVAGRALLDVGCGTGRRLRDSAASFAVGVDLTYEMLVAPSTPPRRVDGDWQNRQDSQDRFPVTYPHNPTNLENPSPDFSELCAGDVRALPLAGDRFDVVWCRLVIGHVAALHAAYAELARVTSAGGTVIVTDLCAEAAAAGHRRTFRDARGEVHEVEHFVHTVDAQIDAARRAGLGLTARRDGTIDERVRPFYTRADKLAAYETQRGLPLVLALAFRKHGSSP